MTRQPVDLSAHINQDQIRGHPADFPVALVRLYQENPSGFGEVPKRRAVARLDTGTVLAVVSDRYTLVPHQQILDTVGEAIRPMDVGPVPRGLFVDRGGARLRALYKFPSLARPVRGHDEICPCLKIQNTYDGSSRIAVHIGAFRFVCTNLAVGGGGVFAGGFVSVHAGEIPIQVVAKQLTFYLQDFESIVALYREWAERSLPAQAIERVLEDLPTKAGEELRRRIGLTNVRTVFDAYNVATDYATHEMRSVRTAFELLAKVNQSFQAYLPVPSALVRYEPTEQGIQALPA